MSLGFVVLVLAATLGWSLWHGPVPDAAPAAAEANLPWRVQLKADGTSEVFGLTLGSATLADVQKRFAGDLHTGLIVPNGGRPALEVYVESFNAGFVTGKLVLAFEADATWLQGARERAAKSEIGEGGLSRRYTLAAADQATARAAPLTALAFVPSARIDEAIAVARFGAPAERLTGPTGELQLLYPALGVAVALPPAHGDAADARPVIQYVAPRDFDARLRAPLRAAAASSAGR